jgi:hypothetical protein
VEERLLQVSPPCCHALATHPCPPAPHPQPPHPTPTRAGPSKSSGAASARPRRRASPPLSSWRAPRQPTSSCWTSAAPSTRASWRACSSATARSAWRRSCRLCRWGGAQPARARCLRRLLASSA